VVGYCINVFRFKANGNSLDRTPSVLTLHYAVPWLRRLVAGLSSWRTGFDPRLVHVGFVVDKVALGQVFPSVSITRKNEKNTNNNKPQKAAVIPKHLLRGPLQKKKTLH
jgi:hypothetical protein